MDWFYSLAEGAQDSVGLAIERLEIAGVALRFPYSSQIKDSRFAMRELRFQYMAEPYRILYIFDPKRNAVLLVGGNKVGKDNSWYKAAIKEAERLYAKYLKEIDTSETPRG
jgi:hypothetical protein